MKHIHKLLLISVKTYPKEHTVIRRYMCKTCCKIIEDIDLEESYLQQIEEQADKYYRSLEP